MMDDHDAHQQASSSAHARRGVGPRLYHKKSRMGCARCKARRVKCDEVRPACGGCSRHQVDCVYSTAKTTSTRTESHPHQHRSEGAAVGVEAQLLHQPIDPSIDVWAAATVDPTESNDFAIASDSASLGGFTGDASSLFAPDAFAASVSDITLGNTSFLAAESPLISDAQRMQAPPSSLHDPTPTQLSSADPSLRTTRAASATVSDNSSSSSSGFNSIVREATDYLSQLADPEILDMSESKERRLWELRLMRNYTLFQSRQFATTEIVARHGEQPQSSAFPHEGSENDPDRPNSRNNFGGFAWGREIMDLAFKNDAVLYSVLMASALEMWMRTSDPKERDHLRLLQQKYQSMALREQRQAVTHLSRDNADDVCMAALTILQNSFVLVQTLPTSPWEPPLDWLRMGKGAGSVLIVARGYLGFRNGDDKITRLVSSMPRMSIDDIFKPEYRTHLTWLLENDGGSNDNIGDHELVGNKVTLNIYHKVLSYIGYMEKAINGKEPLYLVHRRFICFAMWVPELYHEFLAQRRPRALVTLAHFVKLWIPFGDLWQIGRMTGENQVRGIYEECPVEWRHKLDPIFEEYGLEPPLSASPAAAQSDVMDEDTS